MEDDLVLPEHVNPEMLRQLFADAYMDATIDKDGDTLIVETYRSYVVPTLEGKWLRVYAVFGANPDAAPDDKLEYSNKVNQDLIIVRAYVEASGRFTFEHYLPIEGGITRKAIVLAVRRFHRLLEAAIRKDDKNVMS